MKITVLIILFALASCSKDSSNAFNAQLPPETQTGANTFGVTINGKVYVPRDPKGTNVGGSNGHGISLEECGGRVGCCKTMSYKKLNELKIF